MTDARAALPRLILRADGNPRIGLGHVMRLLALFDIVGNEFPTAIFVVRDSSPAVQQLATKKGLEVLVLDAPDAATEAQRLRHILTPADVIVLDGQQFDTAYQRTIRQSGCRIAVIDDLHAWPMEADLIINHGPEATADMYQALPETHFCLGPAFSMVRTEFRQHLQLPRAPAPVTTVLVSFGGADPQHLTFKTLQALLTFGFIREIGVITGAAYPHGTALEHLAAQFPATNAQFYRGLSAANMVATIHCYEAVICPASTILLETLLLGQAAITGYYVADQRTLARSVHRHRQAYSVGNFATLSSQELTESLLAGILFLESVPRQPYAPRLAPEQLRAAFRRLLAS